MEYINEEYINSLIDKQSLNDEALQREVIAKSRDAKGLTLEEAAALLNIKSPKLYEELFHTAKQVKEKIYGNRLVLFAPLYYTNYCVNNCLYCAFRIDNTELTRKALSLDEIENEARLLVQLGHKRLLLLCGEHPKMATLDYLGQSIERIYTINENGNNIRRVNVNIAPLTVDEFKQLNSFAIGTYQIFQETYHSDTYRIMHPGGPKKDMGFRMMALHRAMEAGIGDVGMGALYGLADYRFETLATLAHAFDLEKVFGVGPHTISVPRLEPAYNAPAAAHPPHMVDDLSFKKLVAVIRLAVPYVGIILSTRERAEFRRELFEVGVSQISAGSKTSPGGYKEAAEHLSSMDHEQFEVGDHRSLDEVVKDCCDLGYLPSFCTACYRSQRTGDRFMELAKTGNIGKICVPNALTTFKEYLIDYASDKTKATGEKFLQSELEKAPAVSRKKTENLLERLKNGEHDVYF